MKECGGDMIFDFLSFLTGTLASYIVVNIVKIVERDRHRYT